MSATNYQWNDYADVFSPITSRFQFEMYELTAQRAKGSVIDCGCGSAKLAPYLAENASVTSYLGIDSSQSMIALAKNLLTKLDQPDYSVICSRIENTGDSLVQGSFQCAISLQSYYSWSERERVLEQIYNLLEPGGIFIIGSANESLDIDKLLDKAANELLMYPDWEIYASMNRQYAHTADAHFCSLDELIVDVRRFGFRVKEAHTQLFMGGLNFLVLEK